MTTMQTSFDAATHEYRINGRVVPSVTQIIESLGMIDATWYTEQSRAIGHLVAEATAIDDNFGLAEDSIDPAIAGYVAAWRRFRLDSQCTIDRVESQCFDPLGRYAGTLDRLITIYDRPAIVDIKTGAEEYWHRLQLAGYQSLIAMPHARRLAIYLRDDGTYSCVEFSDVTDAGVFDSALNVVTWKRNNR